MAHHWSDNVHTTAFTPRDYQVELLAAAREKNIIVCVGHNSSKEFIALKLIHELGFELRQNNRKITIYITSDTNGESAYNLIYHLTDLKPINLNIFNDDDINWDKVFECNQVVIMKPDKCLNALVCGYLDLESVNLIVVEDCHKQSGKIELEEIFSNYYVNCVEKPKILGLAGPLHSAGCPPGRLGAELEYLEKSLFCKAETASDIVTVLRYCPKPIEIILQCAPPGRNDLTNFLKELVLTRKAYLMDHRFDPSEIYSDEFMDELKAIPDPKTEPIKFLNSYLEALEELGPWCADRAALSLLVQIEKCKVKTPYERHFLLLCLVSTTFVQVRAYCDYFFQKLPNEKERVEKYSSPKILRVLETLRLFRPDPNFNKTICNTINGNNEENSNVKTNKNRNMTIMKEIEEADFNSLGMSVEQVKENVENEIDLIEAGKIKDSLRNITQRTLEKVPHTQNSPNKRENRHFRTKRRFGPSNRFNKNNYLNNNNDPDALCGILFCNSKFTAKVLFSLFNEMSRNDSELNYLTVQYTVDKVADPITEAKEAENEHRKQEEVLKRFRMHECNLLIGTSVLEEGIDLPKCNLVVRWDPPKTYRSYVQCKGRARAPNAYHVIIVAPKLKMDNDDEREHLSDKSHKFICFTGKTVSYNDKETENEINDGDDIDDDDNDDDDNDNDENSEHLNMIKEHPNAIRVDTQNIKVEQIDDNVEENIVENVEKSSDVTKLNGIIHNHNNDTADINNSDKFRRKINNKKCIRAENKSLFQCPVNICDEQTSSNESVDFQSMNDATNEMVERLAEYMEIEKMLIRNCNNSEPLETEIINADKYTSSVLPYKPLANETEGTSVNLASAVALVNKYCAKLPSDTFTKLTPIWRFAKTFRYNVPMFQCTLRLPINSPIKYDIIGLPMPTKILARRISALIACKMLHLSGELDNNLQPIGKEGFRPTEPDWENFELEESDEIIVNDNSEPRPGTTKRRQYYYKRVASAFSNCRPTVGSTAYLYHISMILKCPIPEEQNTRGRKIYPPEDSPQGFGILTLNKIPKISSFPIFTRSGEVEVSLVLTANNITLDESQLFRINTFINYTFTNVLRLQKYLMLFDPEATENCFFIVPTIKIGQNVSVDWNFLKTINDNAEILPQSISDEVRKEQEFDPNKFKDAVVMPWYRNQDQPQYFYVAEICNHLSPESSFPGENYSTFQEYYYRKYGIQIQNTKQPLLDVDHTSARLNFLTPRYVNRKGVALPTSSEETKRAKRENLEQKQILVPELCTIHPFPASLWRAAVCLPCILYRTNALLLADEIRKQVSKDLGLGTMDINDNKFEWPSLDFGWSLAEVLRKSRESKLTVLPNSNINSTTNNIDKVSKENSISSKTEKNDSEKTANDILEEADRKLKNECMMEIGTWSNEMADNISMTDDEMNDEDWGGILPPNINMCSRNKTQIRYGSPTSWDVKSNSTLIENYYSDSDVSYQSDDDEDLDSVGSDDDKNGKLRIEFKSDNVAEAIETEEEIIKRQKQQAIINDINANEKQYQSTKNIGSGFNSFENQMIDNDCNSESNIKWHEGQFEESIKKLQEKIITSGMLIRYNEKPEILNKKEINKIIAAPITIDLLTDLIPYATETELRNVLPDISENGITKDVKITLEDIYKLNQLYLAKHPDETYVIDGSSDVFDKFNDREKIVPGENKFKTVIIEFLEQLIIPNKGSSIQEQNDKLQHLLENMNKPISNSDSNSITFSFDYQPNLVGHPGPSPSIILQGLTMSNANDGINLERLETIGDSFLKYAITTYLYCTYENVHEGKLSHLRSKQVSNLNLYRLGRKKILGESMISTKFEPHDNWLPPCYYVPRELEKALIEARIPACHWNLADLPNLKELSSEKICELVKKRAQDLGVLDVTEGNTSIINGEHETYNFDNFPCFIPYNLITQHSIPDKSVADCVEALIGAYLIECGPRGALLFMAWLGIRVLPLIEVPVSSHLDRIPGSTEIYEKDNQQYRIIYGTWTSPKSPLLHYAPNPYESLEILLDGFSTFEEAINYKFKDRSYLLQAMTHASYSPNRLTDCYQRLEFLGDAILDYLITRHLYEDPRQHSPGALTDLRSALVNNTIFASLAVRHGFHKYFRHLSPGLNEVIDRFVRIQHENGHSISEEYYLISEEECDEAEDVEVPKALGDVFESVAGAIFLDSNMSLDTVWNVYSNMMRPEIEQFSNSVPKSPIRELLELEPETAKFGKPEKLADGRRVRVIVEVFGKGTFRGIGRNYRIAKCTAAKCALRQLKKQGLINRK